MAKDSQIEPQQTLADRSRVEETIEAADETTAKEWYELPIGKNGKKKKYLRIGLESNIVDLLTETYKTGKDVEATHVKWEAEIFEPMFAEIKPDEVSQDRLDGEYGHLASKVPSIREQYANRKPNKNGKDSSRAITANYAFDVLVKWYNEKG
jgi:hypothetical protein